MKKFKIIILLAILILQIINVKNILAQGDGQKGDLGLGVQITNPPCTITVTIESSSIPFEGRPDSTMEGVWNVWNRWDTVMNGSKHRLFHLNNNVFNYPIYYHTRTLSFNNNWDGWLLDLGSSLELPDSNLDGAWGYARYKITFFNHNTNEKFVFYFNSLDSKYGKKNFPIIPPPNNWDSYSADWKIKYNQNLQKVYISGHKIGHPNFYITFDSVHTWDTVPIKEFKVWEMLGSIGGWNSQWEKKFYARTTPFPIAPNVADRLIRDFTIGTKVIFDTVYNNLSEQDRYGYNTWILSPYPDYYSNPPIPPGENDSGNTFCTPAQYYENLPSYAFGMKITAESGDTVILKRMKKLWISGLDAPNLGGDTMHFKPGSTLILERNAEIFETRGGVLIIEGANLVWDYSACNRAFPNSEIYYKGNNTVNNGAFIVVDGGGKLKIGDNTTLTFDGSNSYLQLKPNSQVKLGTNAKLVFKNGAYLNAQNVTFNASGSNPWEGIYLENAGSQTIISNCTFNTVKNPIKIKNTETTKMGYHRLIKNNTFNMHQNGTHSIYAENVFNILIDGNTFNLPTPNGLLRSGTYIKNYYNTAPANYHINILNNTFSQGQFSVILHSLTSNLTPVYVYNNSFSSSGCADLIGIKISGDIKQNNFSASSVNRNLAFSLSNTYLTQNIMYASNINMNLAGNSTSHLAPSVYNNDYLMWTAGQNKLISQNNDNIQIGFGNIYTDMGNNHFTCSTGNYHFFGHLNTSSTSLKAWNNCWYYSGSNVTRSFLLNNSYQQVTVDPYHTFGYECPNNFPTQTDLIINDLGYDIYDTVIITEKYSGTTLPEDERIYYLALQKMNDELYLDAIAAYKLYIDSYPESQFIHTSLYELYECHEMLDTSDNQEYRDVLYGELRNYLDGRIQSELYDGEFVDIAYNLILMCEANMDNLEIALDGYEFLALFHPDPEARILASWDWDAVLDLLDSGSSGGITEKIIEKDKQRRLKKFEKLIDKDPLMKKVHDTYKAIELEKDQNTEKVIKSRTRDERTVNDKLLKSKDRDMKLNTRASTNLTFLRYLSNEEKEKRVLEDIALIYENKFGDNDIGISNKIIPDNYSLSQNYPNPFNPTTTINYELPKDGTVKLIVYDLLGREVLKLVNNEFKTSGRYSVDFDGRSLSSGIYFYKIESGSFTDVKRMVLLK